MFVLRRITSEKNESNTVLGEVYHLVLESKTPDEFKKAMEAAKISSEQVYGAVVCNEGGKIIPLYQRSKYYVMIGTGQTFANISPIPASKP